jgi:hypothetical protein
MELRLNGFTHETAMKKLHDIIMYVEELQIDVYEELKQLCVQIDQYSTIKP